MKPCRFAPILTGRLRTLQMNAGIGFFVTHPDMVGRVRTSFGSAGSQTENVTIEGDAGVEIGASNVNVSELRHWTAASPKPCGSKFSPATSRGETARNA